MRVALDPRTNQKVTFEQFRVRNRRSENDSMGALLPRARCAACLGDMREIKGTPGLRVDHFSHVERNSGCWLVRRAALPFLHLIERSPDPRAALTMRTLLRSNWKRHYNLLQRLVPKFHIEELFRLLIEADEQDIWSYKDIGEWALPYAMLMFCDFSPKTGQMDGGKPKRTHWYSFYFRTVKSNEDLWIKKPTSTNLIRMKFKCKPGARARPLADDLEDFEVLPLDQSFVTSGADGVHPKIGAGVEKRLSLHWSQVARLDDTARRS